MNSPFDSREVADPYEDWYRTPYGELVDRIETELLLEELAPLRPGASVLEIGCGTGWFGQHLRERGLQVIGLDPARAMLARARERMPVVQGAAAHLPFPSRSFDAALIVGVLDFVDDPAAVLSEARRVVRERVAVIALTCRSYLATRRRLAGWRGHPIFRHTRFYSRARVLEFARASGAEPERVQTALLLPPLIAGMAPSIERTLARHVRLGAGIVAFSLPGG